MLCHLSGAMEHFLEFLLIALFQTAVGRGPPCSLNSDCSVYDICVSGTCIPNHFGCPNNTCLPNEVCIRGQCHNLHLPRYCRPHTNADCSVFEYCADGICQPDNRACPGGTCPPDDVCVNRKCVPHPLQPFPLIPQPPFVTSPVTAAPSGQKPKPSKRPRPTRGRQPRTTAGGLSTPSPIIRPAPPPPPVVPPQKEPIPPTQVKPTSPAAPPAPTCRPGWFHLPTQKACYLVQHGSFNYHQANFNCQSLGVHLVTIRNHDEMLQVNALTGGTPFWVGARKYAGTWFWQDGKTPFNYTNWRRGEPDGCCGRDVSCVLVNYFTGLGEWEDAGCDEHHRVNQGYVCKQNL